MKRWSRLLALALALGFAGQAPAHRLDELLQATRVQVSSRQIEISIRLTPGVAVADPFIAALDGNGDGVISRTESAAYAEELFDHLEVRLNRRPVKLRVTDVITPPVRAMRRGVGVLHVTAKADHSKLEAGRHEFLLTNRHLPHLSVYLVNAVKPEDSRVRILRQDRNELQSAYRLEFELKSAEARWRGH